MNRMTLAERAKPFEISKAEVYAAWLRVKANRGAGGVDDESLATFEVKLSKNLYKLWNRMSSGSYFPQAVRRVEIPKRDGSIRPLGIPTISDRVAQEVVRVRLEVEVEPLFHDDSYGYRPGKSAIDALKVCRRRNWQYDWVLEVDIEKFFDTIDHELLLKAVSKHCREKWMLLYIGRWLKAPVQNADGSLQPSRSGTPQGGVISPLLANLYLHYAFDRWIERQYPEVKFERYADDVVLHCSSEQKSEELKEALSQRLAECRLSLHPDKTRTIYCKDSSRRGDYPNISYTFLGYTFRPRAAQNRTTGAVFTSFLPAASKEAQKRLCSKLRALKLRHHVGLSIDELADKLNPTLRGWFNYFGHFYRSALSWVVYCLEDRLIRWVRHKHHWNYRRAAKWLARVKREQPLLMAHWAVLSRRYD